MEAIILSDENRKLPLSMDSVNAYCSRWKPHTAFEVSIVRRTPRVSSPMRAYYFAEVIAKLGEELGYDIEEIELLHRQLKITYFKLKGPLLEKYKLPEMIEDKHHIWRNVPAVFGNDSEIPVLEKVKFLDWVIRIAGKEGVIIKEAGGD